MPKVLFIWNTALTDGNIGSYRPSVYAAKSIGFDIDIAMNFSDTPIGKRQELEDELGINLINIPIDRSPYSLKNRRAYEELVSLMRRENYDIIHCNTPMGGIIGRLAAYKTKNNRVFYMNRGFAFYKGAPVKNWLLYYPIEKVFARLFTDAIGTINPDDFEIALKMRLRRDSKLKYSLPGPGVELSRFQYSDNNRVKIRNKYKLREEDVLILSVGEITNRKNFIAIINAIGLLMLNKWTRNIADKIYYVIAGIGEMQEQLEIRANELGIKERVIFAGYREDINNFYSAADIYALPSLSEGFGRVGIEAMSVGLPLITSNVQGINLYSIDGKTGYKYDSKDIKGYAKGIYKLANDKELRRKIGEHNKEFAKEFSMERSGDQIAQVYKDLMEKGIS